MNFIQIPRKLGMTSSVRIKKEIRLTDGDRCLAEAWLLMRLLLSRSCQVLSQPASAPHIMSHVRSDGITGSDKHMVSHDMPENRM